MTQSVDKTFSNRMRTLQTQARQLYKSVQCAAQRIWQVSATQVSLHDISGMHKPEFDRTELNNDYDEIVAGKAAGSSNGEVLGLRLQIAVVAAEERAYRHRHMSLARAVATAHGRCYGQGEGALFSPTGIEGDVATYIRAGSAGTGGSAQ